MAAALILVTTVVGPVTGCGNSGTTTTEATTATTKAITTVATASSSYTTHYAPGRSPTTTTEKPTTTTSAPATTTTTHVPKTVVIDASANGGVVDLNLQDRLELDLDGDPTTGYTWAIVAPQVPVLVIQPLGEPDYQAGSVTGQGGTYTWMFESVAQGQNPLVLEYRNPGQALAVRTFSVTVNVH